jgi:hypothetical protein
VPVTGEATQGCMPKLASDRASHLWHQFEREEITRIQLIRRTRPIQGEMRQRLATFDWFHVMKLLGEAVMIRLAHSAGALASLASYPDPLLS